MSDELIADYPRKKDSLETMQNQANQHFKQFKVKQSLIQELSSNEDSLVKIIIDKIQEEEKDIDLKTFSLLPYKVLVDSFNEVKQEAVKEIFAPDKVSNIFVF